VPPTKGATCASRYTEEFPGKLYLCAVAFYVGYDATVRHPEKNIIRTWTWWFRTNCTPSRTMADWTSWTTNSIRRFEASPAEAISIIREDKLPQWMRSELELPDAWVG